MEARQAAFRCATRTGRPGDVATLARLTKTLACTDKTRGESQFISGQKLFRRSGGGTAVLAIIEQADIMTRRNARPVDVLVGQNIRICRTQRGLSQSELAERVGLTFQQIQKYEKAANRVGASRLIQVADALDVPLAALFQGSATATQGEPDVAGGALLADPHAVRLLRAFDRLADPKQRIAVLHLVESVGKAQARGGSAR
jgi:transcriptional regulator with XRE-family HTH domain